MDHPDLRPDCFGCAGDPKRVKDRIDQVVWVLGHLDDLASDFSVLHGITDMTRLSGAAFCKLAFRMTAYQSVMRERVVALTTGDQPAPGGRPAAAPVAEPRREVPATKAALQADPVMGSLFSFGSMT